MIPLYWCERSMPFFFLFFFGKNESALTWWTFQNRWCQWIFLFNFKIGIFLDYFLFIKIKILINQVWRTEPFYQLSESLINWVIINYPLSYKNNNILLHSILYDLLETLNITYDGMSLDCLFYFVFIINYPLCFFFPESSSNPELLYYIKHYLFIYLL